MVVKEDTKTKAKQIVALLPKTNCGKCGYDNCGKFAKAVAEGNASPFGCRENAAAGHRISEILGIKVSPQQANNASIPQIDIPIRMGLITQKRKGAHQKDRYGRSKRKGLRRGRSRLKETSLWGKIKSFLGHR